MRNRHLGASGCGVRAVEYERLDRSGPASEVRVGGRTSVEFRDEPVEQTAERLDVLVRPVAEPFLESLALMLSDTRQAGEAGVGEFQQLGPGARRMRHPTQQAVVLQLGQ